MLGKFDLSALGEFQPLSIEQLEAGLQILDAVEINTRSFWEQHAESFRLTVLLAIRETSDALLTPTLPPGWRAGLENDLEDLVGYLELANRYLAQRAISRERLAEAKRRLAPRLH